MLDLFDEDDVVVQAGLVPLRLTADDVCHLLRITRDHLHKLTVKDPSFPKKYKAGASRQATVYFDYEEVKNWYETQKKLFND